jgi:ribosomal protein S18 acetylase RimI-like enzyme
LFIQVRVLILVRVRRGISTIVNLNSMQIMNMKIEQAFIEDAAEILALQKLAYLSEAEIYDDFTIPPLLQTLEETMTEFDTQFFLKIMDTGRIIGSVRAYLDQGTCYIGKLIVHPDFQNLGLGTRLLNEIEARFNQANRFELFTGHQSKRNLHVYRKLGYKIFSSEPATDNLTMVFLEKINEPGA